MSTSLQTRTIYIEKTSNDKGLLTVNVEDILGKQRGELLFLGSWYINVNSFYCGSSLKSGFVYKLVCDAVIDSFSEEASKLPLFLISGEGRKRLHYIFGKQENSKNFTRKITLKKPTLTFSFQKTTGPEKDVNVETAFTLGASFIVPQ